MKGEPIHTNRILTLTTNTLFFNKTLFFLSFWFLLCLILYFYIFTKIKILKIIKKAIIFKIIITILYLLLNFWGYENYYIYFTYVILLSLFIGLYMSKKEDRFHKLLIIVFILLFWYFITYLLSSLDFLYLLCSLIFSIINWGLSEFNINLDIDDNSNFNSNVSPNPASPSNEEEIISTFNPLDIFHHDLTDPSIFNYHINLLNEGIALEKNKNTSLKDFPFTPDSFKPFISLGKTVGWINEENYNILIKYLKEGKFNEFHDKLPKTVDYLSWLQQALIIDNKIYISENLIYSFMEPSQVTEAQKNPIFITPKINYPFPVSTLIKENIDSEWKLTITVRSLSASIYNLVSIYFPTVNILFDSSLKPEFSEDTSTNLFDSTSKIKQKYFFYGTISDFKNSVLKYKIDIHNSKLQPFDKVKFAEEWAFFKEYYFIGFIEKPIAWYLNFSTYLQEPLNELTPIKLLFSKMAQIFEYMLELDTLNKIFIGLDLNLLVEHPELSELDKKICEKYFYQYWMRQISFYTDLSFLDEGKEFTSINMYHIAHLREELLENILFVQAQILEGWWTINTLDKLIPVCGGYDALDTEDKVIEFYNKLYKLYQIEIEEKYKDTFVFRREFLINRFSNASEVDIVAAYKWISYLNHYWSYKSPLTKDNFSNTLSPTNNPKNLNK